MGYVGSKPSAVPLTSADITDGIITSAKIADGTIANTDISTTAAIATSKLGAGAVLQVVTATDTTTRSITSSSFVTGSNTLSISITPASTSNKIFIIATCCLGMSATSHTAAITIYRGSTDLGSGSAGMSFIKGIGDDGMPCSVSVLDSPSSTSSLTYQIYVKNLSGGTTYLNQGKSSITAFEIAG